MEGHSISVAKLENINKNSSPCSSENCSTLLKNTGDCKEEEVYPIFEVNEVDIKEECLSPCSPELESGETLDGPLVEVIEDEEHPSLDPSEFLELSMVKSEKMFDHFDPSSLQNEGEDQPMASSSNEEISPTEGSPNDYSRRQNDSGPKSYMCSFCGKSFSQASSLKKHIRIHTGEKPHRCNICGKTFTQSDNLKTHIRIHTGEKPYKCDICGRAFSDSSNLKTHNIFHTGEKPHHCDICGRSFSLANSLKTHIRTHTGEKPYKCDICGKAFPISYSLKTHYRTHTGEKPHKCDICGRGFPKSSDLRTHMRIHTGEKPHSCNICGKAFSRLSCLKIHHNRMHPGFEPLK